MNFPVAIAMCSNTAVAQGISDISQRLYSRPGFISISFGIKVVLLFN